MPWCLRVKLKIDLARLPASSDRWKRLRFSECGSMEDPASALNILLMHARGAQLIDKASDPPRFVNRPDFVVLGTGPGDSTAVGVAAKALRVARSMRVDTADFARGVPAIFRADCTSCGATFCRPCIDGGAGCRYGSGCLRAVLLDGRREFTLSAALSLR